MGALENLQRRKLSLDEFHRMGEAGILREDDRVELIEGDLIQMAPIGTKHFAKVNRLSRLFSQAVGKLAIVSTQNPIALPAQNEPQPDIAILKPRDDDYEGQLPAAQDVLLLVEVADTTLAYDRDVKVPIYARHGIVEVWLVDVNTRQLFVHRDPTPNGYQQVFIPSHTEKLSLFALSDVVIDLGDYWR